MFGYPKQEKDDHPQMYPEISHDKELMTKSDPNQLPNPSQPSELGSENQAIRQDSNGLMQLEGAASILLSLNLHDPGSWSADDQPEYAGDSSSGTPQQPQTDHDRGPTSDFYYDGHEDRKIKTEFTLNHPSTSPSPALSRRRKNSDTTRDSHSVTLAKRRRNDHRKDKNRDRRNYSSSSSHQLVHCRVCGAGFPSDSAMYGHMRHCKPNRPIGSGTGASTAQVSISPAHERKRSLSYSSIKTDLSKNRRSLSDHRRRSSSFEVAAGSALGIASRVASGSGASEVVSRHGSNQQYSRVLRSRRRKDSFRNVIFTFEDAIVCERRVRSGSGSSFGTGSAYAGAGSPSPRSRRDMSPRSRNSSFRAFERIAARASVTYGCRHCGKLFMSKYALSGHYRHCMKRKAMPASRGGSGSGEEDAGPSQAHVREDDHNHDHVTHLQNHNTTSALTAVAGAKLPPQKHNSSASGGGGRLRSSSSGSQSQAYRAHHAKSLDDMALARNRSDYREHSRGWDSISPHNKRREGKFAFRGEGFRDSAEMRKRYPIIQRLGFRDVKGCSIHRNRFLVLRPSCVPGPTGDPPTQHVPYRIAKAMGPLQEVSPIRADGDGSSGKAGCGSASVSHTVYDEKNSSFQNALAALTVHVMGYKLSGFRSASSARWRCQHWTETIQASEIFGVVERLPKEGEVVALGEYLEDVYDAKIVQLDLHDEEVTEGNPCENLSMDPVSKSQSSTRQLRANSPKTEAKDEISVCQGIQSGDGDAELDATGTTESKPKLGATGAGDEEDEGDEHGEEDEKEEHEEEHEEEDGKEEHEEHEEEHEKEDGKEEHEEHEEEDDKEDGKEEHEEHHVDGGKEEPEIQSPPHHPDDAAPLHVDKSFVTLEAKENLSRSSSSAPSVKNPLTTQSYSTSAEGANLSHLPFEPQRLSSLLPNPDAATDGADEQS